MNNHPVFRINQTGYAAGMPVYIAFLGEGTVRLTDGSGRLLRELHQMPSPIDQSSGDPSWTLGFCLKAAIHLKIMDLPERSRF